MIEVLEGRSDGELIALIVAALDALTDDRLRLDSDRQRLDVALAGLRVAARLHAWQTRVLADIDRDEVAWREHRTSATTWLAESARLTAREARGLVGTGQTLQRFGGVAAAASAGELLPGQVRAIGCVLAELPQEFAGSVVHEAEGLLVGFAQTHNAAELRRLGAYLVEVLAPESAEALEAERLERQLRRARAHRHLEFHSDGCGSVLFRGSLPVLDAEPWIAMIEAHVEVSRRAAADAADPHAEYVSPGMRRADALIAMVRKPDAHSARVRPVAARPLVVVTLGHDQLLAAGCLPSSVQADTKDPDHARARPSSPGSTSLPIRGRLARSEERVAGSALRQLLCDANLLPVVLGGRSEPLDVGPRRRLVTPPIRVALELRDRGCVFPGCDAPPGRCDAHHVVPWWSGGSTSLENLVLLCPHHHGIVEPGHDPHADRWSVRLGTAGLPEVLPPGRVDPRRRARLHARFCMRRE